MADHGFCRHRLRNAMVEVRKQFTPEEIRAAWAWDVSGGRGNQFEFHGPRGFYLHDVKMADCRWSAAASGWISMLDALDDAGGSL